jgi:PTS system nitrogen regulatory IIA component
MAAVSLGNALRRDCCGILRSSTKTEALIELIELVRSAGLVESVENLKREIFYREQLMSTGIGLGLGVPHVRHPDIRSPVLVVGVQRAGISDYASIDDEPVRIVVMILVPEHQHKEHIRLLSLVVRRLKQDAVRDRLLAAADAGQIHSILAAEG